MAEVAIPRQTFQEILSLIARTDAACTGMTGRRVSQMRETTTAEVRLE
jgi:hypothetical protein